MWKIKKCCIVIVWKQKKLTLRRKYVKSKNKIDFETAKNKVLKVENVNLIDIDENNVDEVLFYAKEDYYKKSNAMGGLQ